jgi:ABC-2 type transport system ATP-binding protein
VTWGTRSLRVRFGTATALDGVDLTVAPGAVHAVIGGDGSGKSTLLRVLAGVRVPYEGQVSRPPAGQVGFVSTSGGTFPDLTVAENIEFVADAYRLRDWRDRADELLERAGIGGFRDRLAGQLSGGQRRKLAGTMALLPQPRMLVLDEVTTGVDPLSRMELWRMVSAAAAAGTAVVAATTYLDEAERSGSVVLLHQGRVIAEGSPRSIVEGLPGGVVETGEPDDPDRAWRHGPRWRQWCPDGDRDRRVEVSLEEAAIIAELHAEATARP